MALAFVTFIWGDKYAHSYVTRLYDGVARNYGGEFKFIVVTDIPRHIPRKVIKTPMLDPHLCDVPGCFARLRVFDPQWQKAHGIDDRLVQIDLDAVVTGRLDELVADRGNGFTILKGINTTNPCPNNGSVWMLKAGYRPDVWSDFSLDNYKRQGVPFHSFPDDQGWFHHKMPDAAAFGPATGVYGFKKEGWPDGDDLPDNAKIVAFPGFRDPENFKHLEWVKTHWGE